MESLESKLDHLSPDQRKEVEDFVDFLLFRSGSFSGSPAPSPDQPQIQKVAPPLIVQETVHLLETPQVTGPDATPGENPSIPVPHEEPVTSFQEIATGSDDRIARDYMDYGQFEQNLSPAIIAVKNVKEKLQKREKQEKTRELLDWID